MRIGPTVEFPKRYDEVYYPGRRATHWSGYVIGIAVAAIGAGCLFAPSPDSDPQSMALFGVFLLALGGAAFAGTWMVRERTAIALTAEGLYYRTWRGRIWHLPWDDVEQITIGGTWHRSQNSEFGSQQEAVYLTGRFVPGGRTTVKATIRSRVLPQESDVQGDPMVAAIIARAGLVPGEAKRHEATWVRDRESRVGGRESGTAEGR